MISGNSIKFGSSFVTHHRSVSVTSAYHSADREGTELRPKEARIPKGRDIPYGSRD